MCNFLCTRPHQYPRQSLTHRYTRLLKQSLEGMYPRTHQCHRLLRHCRSLSW